MLPHPSEPSVEETRDRALFFRTLLDEAFGPVLAFAAFIGAAIGLMGGMFAGMAGMWRGEPGVRSRSLVAHPGSR